VRVGPPQVKGDKPAATKKGSAAREIGLGRRAPSDGTEGIGDHRAKKRSCDAFGPTLTERVKMKERTKEKRAGIEISG